MARKDDLKWRRITHEARSERMCAITRANTDINSIITLEMDNFNQFDYLYHEKIWFLVDCW